MRWFFNISNHLIFNQLILCLSSFQHQAARISEKWFSQCGPIAMGLRRWIDILQIWLVDMASGGGGEKCFVVKVAYVLFHMWVWDIGCMCVYVRPILIWSYDWFGVCSVECLFHYKVYNLYGFISLCCFLHFLCFLIHFFVLLLLLITLVRRWRWLLDLQRRRLPEAGPGPGGQQRQGQGVSFKRGGVPLSRSIPRGAARRRSGVHCTGSSCVLDRRPLPTNVNKYNK